MSNSEISIEEETMLVLAEIADIKGQIEAAKARAKEFGEYADAIWMAKANSALRYKQNRHQELLRLGAAERRKAKAQNSYRIECAFMDAARRLLDQETFAEIMDEAHAYIRQRSSHE